MGSSYNFSLVDNDTLLRRLGRLIDHDRQHETEILAHIAEVDSRRLFAELAYPSMFAYCLGELHLSEAEAFLRINAARATRRFPVLLEKVAAGEIHLCAIKLLRPHLTAGNCAQLLTIAKHASKRTLETRLAELFPREPVKDSLRKLPVRKQPSTRSLATLVTEQPKVIDSLRQDSDATSTAKPELLPLAATAREQPRDKVAALAADRFKVVFTANGALRSKIDRAKELLPVGNDNLASLFDRALDSLINDLERKRFGKKQRAKDAKIRSEQVPELAASEDGARNRKRSRTISRSVRGTVDARDGGQCTFARAERASGVTRRGIHCGSANPQAAITSESATNIA